ncbi:MAG TPA: hypothetical protein VFX84_02680 [Candidatus Saccharimonadales bacterium]|nr:hypothetical protein [Candidatus Saccharimonadales bacterium]
MEPNQEPSAKPPEPGIPQITPSDDRGMGSTPPPFTPAADDTPPAPTPPAPPPPGPPAPASPEPPIGAPQPIPPSPQSSVPPPVVGDGGMTPPSSQQPFVPSDPVVSASKRRFPRNKLLISLIALVLILTAGAAAFYFGYYNNPSVIYSQSLANTGKGYDRLIDYADNQAGKYDKGYSGSGSYKMKAAGFSTDGKAGYKTDGKNAELTFDIGAAATRINADIRTIQSSGDTPDIYVKAGGIKGLGTLLAMPSLDAELAKLDDQWIVIDHTFIDSLSAAGAGDTDSSPGDTAPTREQVIDGARAFGRVNKEYLFTTEKDKAVTEVVTKVGPETVDGHNTYHYKVALKKANVKKYIRAQKDALKSSKLNDWLKENGYDKTLDDNFDAIIEAADDIKASDTYDVWMDKDQRVLYKVRFNDKDNPASNYLDVGLNYKGGSEYPIFLAGKSKENGQTATFSLTVTIDTDTGKTGVKFGYKTDGSDKSEFTGDFSLQPNDSAPKIEKPDKAKSISEVLSELDAGLLGGAPASSSSSGANTGTVTLFRELLEE